MKRWNIVAIVGLLIPPSIVIGLYMYIGRFNRMLGDDYCTMYIGQRLGLLRSVWYWYRSWHGGFSASAADWLLSFLGPKALPFYTSVFLLAWILFAAIAAKNVLRFQGYASSDPLIAPLLGIFLVFATLSISPDLPQSLFWWGGARGYLVPPILFMLYLALYFSCLALPLNHTKKLVGLFVSFGLAFFIGGFSETFTPVMVVLFAGLVAIRLLARKFSTKDLSLLFLMAGFVGALLALSVMVLAPGNSARQSFFPAPPDIFTILRVASASYLAFLLALFTSPYTLTAILGSILGSAWLGMRINREANVSSSRGWWISAFLCAGLVLAFGCFPPAVYGTSEPPPGRTLVIPAFFMIICFLAAGFLWGEWLISHTKNKLSWSSVLFVVACSLIMFSSWNAFRNLYSMREQYISFAQLWDQVDAEINDAKKSGAPKVNIPSLKNWANIEYPTDNPKYWPNICYSKFYDINVFAPPLQP